MVSSTIELWHMMGQNEGALYHHRAHPALKNGNIGVERVIKACILAFPSIWVGCNAILWVTPFWKNIYHLVSCQSIIILCFVSHFPEFLFCTLIPVTHILSKPWFFLSLPLCSSGCEWPSLTCFLSLPWLDMPSVLSRVWVPLVWVPLFVWNISSSTLSREWVILTC